MASPFGAVGLYIANNTIKHGLIFGLTLCFIATIPDIFYAGIAAFSLISASDFLATNAMWLEMLGALVAFGMGVYLLRQRPQVYAKYEINDRATHNKQSAIFITFAMAALYIKTILITGIAFVAFRLVELITSGIAGLVVLLVGVFCGAFSAYVFVAYITHKAHGLITPKKLHLVHRIAGSFLLILGIFLLIFSLLRVSAPVLF